MTAIGACDRIDAGRGGVDLVQNRLIQQCIIFLRIQQKICLFHRVTQLHSKGFLHPDIVNEALPLSLIAVSICHHKLYGGIPIAFGLDQRCGKIHGCVAQVKYIGNKIRRCQRGIDIRCHIVKNSRGGGGVHNGQDDRFRFPAVGKYQGLLTHKGKIDLLTWRDHSRLVGLCVLGHKSGKLRQGRAQFYCHILKFWCLIVLIIMVAAESSPK